MIAFIARQARRGALLTAWVASVVAFVLFWAVPNVDPSYWLGGAEKGTNETRARATEEYGLDDPLPVQYVRLMEGIVTGDVECFYGCGNLRDGVRRRAAGHHLARGSGRGCIAVGLGVWLGAASASATAGAGRTG